MAKAEEKNVCIHLPSDSIIADKFANDANISSSMSTNIPDGWMGLILVQWPAICLPKLSTNQKPFYGTAQWVFLKWKVFNMAPKPLPMQ